MEKNDDLECELTQVQVLDEATMHASDQGPVCDGDQSANQPCLEAWGVLKRKDGGEDLQMKSGLKDGQRTYSIGRSKSCDMTVLDKRISSRHCLIYCDYDHARRRVYVEDCSANGTYVNDSLTRLTKGERFELKSGDEIFLVNPRLGEDSLLSAIMFVNLRERLVVQRSIALAPSHLNDGNTRQRYIEDFYVIGDPIGSGMCGQVHICVECATGIHCVS